MKYLYRSIIALSSFLLGLSVLLSYQSFSSEHKLDQIAPVANEGKVSFRFQQCSNGLSVFELDNQTEEAIYAPVQVAALWRWPEYYDAGLKSGLVVIESKSPDSQRFEDVTLPLLRQPAAFFIVPAQASIRYGVELQKMEGVYRVTARYLNFADGVASVSRGESGALVAQNLERVNNSWKEVRTGSMANQCK